MVILVFKLLSWCSFYKTFLKLYLT